MPSYYPIMLDIRERSAIVLGGDRIAAEKAAALVTCGAQVSVISPEFCAEMLVLAEHGQVELRRKKYEPGDLAGAFVVVAATTDEQMIEAIWQETQRRGQPVNIVDVPRYCSFILPSVLRRGRLTVAVSTEGASPGLAKRVRQQLEGAFPAAYGAYVELAALVRAHLREQGVSYQVRDDCFRDFFNSEILARLVEGERTQAIAIAAELLHRYGVEVPASALEASLAEENRYA